MKKFFLLWLLIALAIAVLLSSINVPRLYPLARRGVPVCGTMTDFEPSNHREAHYSYVVNGKIYSGSQQGGTGDQSGASHCGSSDGYLVYYLPEEPGISCLGHPRALLGNEVGTIALGVLIFPLLSLLGWRWRSARLRRI